MKLIFLDTETTGSEKKDRICQLSFVVTDSSMQILGHEDSLCLPPLDIGYRAMSIHHITLEMVQNKPKCKDTNAYVKLNELNNADNVLVIQNASFDLGMLAKEGFENEMAVIDTYRILRGCYFEDVPHSLQYKRYQWGLYKKEKQIENALGKAVAAHDALGDVIVLHLLFEKLLRRYDIETMIQLCQSPMLLPKMPFGKHKGKSFEELAVNNRGSLSYMLQNMQLDEDLVHSIQHSLEKTANHPQLKLEFGKYKDKTIAQIAQIESGYLQWLYAQENIANDLKERIKPYIS